MMMQQTPTSFKYFPRPRFDLQQANSTTNIDHRNESLKEIRPQFSAASSATTAGVQGQVVSAPGAGFIRGQVPLVFDGKRMRKAVLRKTVDYNSSIVRLLEERKFRRDQRDRVAFQPDASYCIDMMPPSMTPDNPLNAITTKFVRTSTNKLRCPIFCVVWTPEGRRLVTGASSGEFTLWNGLTFNFETILQAHDSPVRAMSWSHNDTWLLSGDHAGGIKYWQSNMNNVKMYEAHKEPIRDLSFSPSDNKFVTGSDDGTVKIWDFYRCHEERVLRGHGAEVRCLDWHPQKGILASGSKDSQQPIKFWDPRTGSGLATLHTHKSTVMSMKWNQNGNWLLTASRDHLCKIFDIRAMKEMQTFRGHKKEATTIAWHPVYESMFASGGSDGSIMFWLVGTDKDIGAMEQAHDGMVWSMAWHPLGHILCSGSNDHSSKFWTRNRPGDRLRDKYNLNLPEEEEEYESQVPGLPSSGTIPGMDAVYTNSEINLPASSGSDIPGFRSEAKQSTIPGLSSPPAGARIGIPGLGSPTTRKPPASSGIPGLGEPPNKSDEKSKVNKASNLRHDAPVFRPQLPTSQFNKRPQEKIPGLDSDTKDIPGQSQNPRFPFQQNLGPRPPMTRPPQEPQPVEKKPLLPDPSHLPGFPPFGQNNQPPPGLVGGSRPPDQRPPDRNALLPDPPGMGGKIPEGNVRPSMDRPPESRDHRMGFDNRDPRQQRQVQETWMRGDHEREGGGPPDFDRSRRGLLDVPPEYGGRPAEFRPPFGQAGPVPENRPPTSQSGPGLPFRSVPPDHPEEEPWRHQDMNSRGFRQGNAGRGRGREGGPPPWEERDHEELDREHQHPQHPFLNQLSSRGFRNQPPGSSPSRGPPDESRGPGRPADRGPHGDRRGSFEDLHFERGGPGGGPGIGGMGPSPGPGGPSSGPRPLMSLDIVPPPVDQKKTRTILEDEKEKGPPDRRGRDRDRPEGDRGSHPDWDRPNWDRPGGPPRQGHGAWGEPEDSRNRDERWERPGDPRMRRGPEDQMGRPIDPRGRPSDMRGRPEDPRVRPDESRGSRPEDPRGRPDEQRGRPEDLRNRPGNSQRPDDPRSRGDIQRGRMEDSRGHPPNNSWGRKPEELWAHHGDNQPPILDESRRRPPEDPRRRPSDEQRGAKPVDPRARKRPMNETQFTDDDKHDMEFQAKMPRSEGEVWNTPPIPQQAPPKEDWFSSWGEEKSGFKTGHDDQERSEQRGRGRGRGRP